MEEFESRFSPPEDEIADIVLEQSESFGSKILDMTGDLASHAGNFIKRHKKAISILATVATLSVYGNFYREYEFGQAAQTLQQSGAPTGHAAGMEAARVLSDKQSVQQIFTAVTNEYETLPPNEQKAFIEGLATIIINNTNSPSQNNEGVAANQPSKSKPSQKTHSTSSHSGGSSIAVQQPPRP